MDTHTYIIVFITIDSATEARQIAKALLERKKAACVNIVSEIESHFWWADNLELARESLLIVKTKAILLPEIINLVKSMHHYSTPEIIALPIVGGNPDYLDWIGNNVS